jgi:hypothetical protein
MNPSSTPAATVIKRLDVIRIERFPKNTNSLQEVLDEPFKLLI